MKELTVRLPLPRGVGGFAVRSPSPCLMDLGSAWCSAASREGVMPGGHGSLSPSCDLAAAAVTGRCQRRQAYGHQNRWGLGPK